MKTPKHVMSDVAEPVSSLCCSSIRLVLGGRMIAELVEAGMIKIVNIQGLRLPSMHTKKPLMAMVAKHEIMIDLCSHCLESRT